MKTEFKVGDNAVHLSHGVGVIRGIEEWEFSPGKVVRFYIMEIHDNGAPKKVFIPIDNPAQRLRRIIKSKDVERVYETLRSPAPIEASTWSMRYREYMEKIHTGDVFQIAEVLRALFDLKSEKDLSFGERKLLDQALSLLVKEIALATNTTEPEVEREIERAVTGQVTCKHCGGCGIEK